MGATGAHSIISLVTLGVGKEQRRGGDVECVPGCLFFFPNFKSEPQALP